MKKIFALLLAALMVLSMAACGGQETNVEQGADFKVCVMTPTLSWSEDQYRAGEEMVAKYPGIVEHLTLPDDFAAEQETGITQIMNIAKNPEYKALVIC